MLKMNVRFIFAQSEVVSYIFPIGSVEKE